MVETLAFRRSSFGVTWSRATLSAGSAHESRSQSVPRVDPEISRSSADGGGGTSCARPAAANCRRTRAGDRFPERSQVTTYTCLCRIDQSAGEPDHAMAEGNQLAGAAAGIPPFAQEVLGPPFLGQRIPGRQLGHDHRRDDSRIHRRARRRADHLLCVSINLGKYARKTLHVSAPSRHASASSTRTPSIAGGKRVLR
jgi:hypothetical protein